MKTTGTKQIFQALKAENIYFQLIDIKEHNYYLNLHNFLSLLNV